MKLLPAIPAICMSLLLFSCGNDAAKEEAKAADTVAAVATPPVEVKPVFSPFKVVVIQHKVKNFAKSVAGYFHNDSLRTGFGITHFILGRDLKDTNTVFVMDKIEDVDKAKSYFNQAKVKDAMKKAGVSYAPGFTYAEMVRMEDGPSDSTLNVAVTHHVKDYAAWLKAFDADASTRPANGLIDRGIARNLYDSNTVSVFFVVTDAAKVKTRMASPEFKKVLADAGVDGTPTVRWFKEVK
jgi:hypothetical protein